jgi:hypothetical protein
MSDAGSGGSTPSPPHPNGNRPEAEDAGPQPVTAEGRGGATSVPPAGGEGERISPVTDEERNRFGALLDKAAERGLLGPADYDVRLRELADAQTAEEMMAIVTDLPAFRAAASAAPTGTAGSRPAATRDLPSGAPFAPMAPDRARPRRETAHWFVLIVLVAVVVVALAVLAIVAAHLHRTPSGTTTSAVLSALRL